MHSKYRITDTVRDDHLAAALAKCRQISRLGCDQIPARARKLVGRCVEFPRIGVEIEAKLIIEMRTWIIGYWLRRRGEKRRERRRAERHIDRIAHEPTRIKPDLPHTPTGVERVTGSAADAGVPCPI